MHDSDTADARYAAPLDTSGLYDGLMWRRACGYLLDVVVIGIVAVIVWLVLGLVGVMTFGLLLPLQFVALAVLPLAYHTLFIGHRGRTPGMAAFDVEVRDLDGARPDYVQALIMTVLFYLSVALTSWLILLVALFNDRHRTLHDYLSGSIAVRCGARPL